jgi:hypothetical protein
MEFVKRRNPKSNGDFYEIPLSVATLLEDSLSCRTALGAKHGLRWENGGKGLFFFDQISSSGCTLYILPTAYKEWKTPDKIRKVIHEETGSEIGNCVTLKGKNQEHLRIVDISWELVEKFVSPLARWILENENVNISNVVMPQRRRQSTGTYIPEKKDIETARHQMPHSVKGIDAILDQVEKNILADGKILQDNWRMIAERNIAIWFK